MQAVLSKEVTFDGKYDPLTLYRALRLINPSPYMFYMSFEEFNVIGASLCEILVQHQNDKVTIRPIAGTRKRGLSESEDLSNKIDLLDDEKEKAEHMMLVDLARNDLSKVSLNSPGDEMMIIENILKHMTSNVIGQKKKNIGRLFKGSPTCGTLSGTPKIRAMEILSEHEDRVRGIYGGSVGYIGFNGNLDTAIVIRTAIHTDESVKVGVGGGIVFDSTPKNEWHETESKLAVLRGAEIQMKICLIDNYDSFTFNLEHQLASFDISVDVVRNDETSIQELEEINYDAFVLGPGPSKKCWHLYRFNQTLFLSKPIFRSLLRTSMYRGGFRSENYQMRTYQTWKNLSNKS